MDNIGTIASVIAAIATTITLFFTIRNSKGNIVKRIERKREQIRDLETQVCRIYGINVNARTISPWGWKISKLERQIEELEKRI